MNEENLNETAQQIIGENKPDDYIIHPAQHAKYLEERAPALSAILSSTEMKESAGQYEKLDQQAVNAQKRFKSISNLASWTIIGSAICSTGLLVISILTDGTVGSPDNLRILTGNPRTFAVSFALCGILFGAGAVILLNLLRTGRLLGQWMQNRAEAEMQRLQYFTLVTSKQVDSKNESNIPISLLQLEYFRRFQLDVQLNYYTSRGAEHDSAAQKTLLYSSIAMGVVA